MKSIKSILILLIGMMALLNVSCSNENEQKKQNELTLSKDYDLVPISTEDANYTMLINYSDYLSYKFVVTDEKGDKVWSNPSIEQLQEYFDINYITNRPKVICHEHVSGNESLHYVTVQADNGDYYMVMVNTFYSPPKATVYAFGSYNPCGHTSEYSKK